MALIPTLGFGSASTLNNGLVSYWLLGETSGTRNDSVGSNHLTDNNTVGYDTGKNGNCASFVAVNPENLSASLDLPTNLSLALWLKWTATGGFPAIIRYGYSRKFYFSGSGTGSYFGSQADSDNAGTLGIAGQWAHILFTYDGTDLKFYVDNTIKGTNASFTLGANATLRFGGESYGYSTSLVDEIALWNRVLTSDERTELYNGGAGKFHPY